MDNSKHDTALVKTRCQNKAKVPFRGGKELNGWVAVDGRLKTRVTVSHGRKFIPPKTYKSIARQLLLHVDELDKFLECSMKSDDYFDTIRDRRVDTFISLSRKPKV